MDLAQLRMVQWLAIIGSIAGVLSLMALWESPFKLPIIIVTVVLIIFGFLVEIHRDRVAIFFSGVRKLHSSFAPEMNRAIFSTVRTEYCYLGVGFSTVSTTFRSWYESDRKPNVRIRLLLTDPDAIDVLEFQARYEHNLFGDGLTAEQQDILKKTICRAQDGIKLTIDLVRTLSLNSPPVEIRLHREKLRKWVHFIDRRVLHLGILRAGVSGLESPLIVLTPVPNRWGLFDHEVEEFESLWSCAKPLLN